MDYCRNVSFSGEYSQDQLLSSPSSNLDDLFSPQNTEVDFGLEEWLLSFMEDCLSSTGNCICLPEQETKPKNIEKAAEPSNPKRIIIHSSFHKFLVPGKKARSKRKRATNTKIKSPLTSWSYNNNNNLTNPCLTNSDPPLLKQTYWLADSELIVSKIEENRGKVKVEEKLKMVVEEEEEEDGGGGGVYQQQPRRCSHCLSQRTPQWRAGPLGPKTLCNACGVRYKSGRLLPEYRPAKSPTFISYLHSNSHKKVMEMRMTL